MIKTSEYPLNFSEIEKGDVLDTPTLEKIVVEKFGTDSFTFKVLSLQGKITDETGYTCKNTGDTLLILTDEQASLYNDRMFKRMRRGMFHRHQLMQNVDVKQLSDSARLEHERKILNQSRYISALRAPKTFKVGVESDRKQLVSVNED